MQSFEYFAPTQIIFGKDTENRAGALAKSHGASRVLVVYGGSSAKKSGLLDRVLHALEAEGLAYETHGGAQPNPRLRFAEEGVRKALAFQADFILAIGGGSAIDAAKGIADGAASPGTDLWDIWTKKVTITDALPVGAVLTIPAAGSETSDSAVLTNDDTLVKRGLSLPYHRPRFAVMNPELAFSLPAYQLACGITDIMMHTLDRYFNPVTTNELTDEIAEGLLRTVIRNGKDALENGVNDQNMSEIMWCGSVSHVGLTGLGNLTDFAPHQLGHELSAKFDIAHGASLATMWASWARYCYRENPARFAQYGTRVLGLEKDGKQDEVIAEAAIDETEKLFRSFGMPTCFSETDFGIQPDDTIEDLAVRCTFYGERTIGTFRTLGRDDILEIYRLANR